MTGYTKIIKSGDIIEIYDYSKDKPSGRKPGSITKRRRQKYFKRMSRRSDHVAEYKRNFSRLVWANLTSKEPPALLTLTMLQVMEISAAYKELTAFFRRLRLERRLGSKFRFISVPEFQKRGAVHFHCLLWGVPKSLVENERTTRYLQRQWLRGFCDIIFTNGDPKLAGYLGKYMSKALQDSRLVGKKGYSASRNIMRPVSLSGPVQTSYFDDIVPVDNFLEFEKQYPTMWLGRCHYRKYKIN